MAVKRGKRSRRLSRADWVKAALEAMAEGGVVGVNISNLATGLGVTKGSFYWHFRDRDDLIDAAMKQWHEQSKIELQAVLAPLEDQPYERLRQLFRQVTSEWWAPRVHAALLRAIDDPRIREFMAWSTRENLDIAADAYHRIGQSPRQAMNSARLAYGAHLGFVQMSIILGSSPMAGKELEEYVEQAIQRLIPADQEG